MNKKLITIGTLVMGVAFAGLVSCSSSYDGSGVFYLPPATGAAVISKGAMTKGSTTVTGIRFEDTYANITADDTVKTPAYLASGMTVKVKGTRNADGITGTADRIEVENEVRGPIASKGTDTFVVLGQTVLTDGGTIFANVTPSNDFSGLAVGDHVEVHGQRDAVGVIHATRIEEFGVGTPVVDEVRGIVSGLTGTLSGTFNIGSLVISYDDSSIKDPVTGTLANGVLVEVHVNSSLYAVKIEFEDLEDVEFEPAEGAEFEVEGFIAGFSAHPGSFTVADEPVQTTASTRFEGGVPADLADGVRVEAEGHMTGGVLVAGKITFKETIRIEANADANGSAGTLGLTVQVTSLTEWGGGLTVAGDIVQGNGLRIRGFLNLDGATITATRVERLSNPVAAGNDILQGPVSSFNTAANTLVIAGITVNIGSVPANDIKNDDDNVITLSQFYASLTAGKTIVKVRFNSSTFIADKVEIE